MAHASVSTFAVLSFLSVACVILLYQAVHLKAKYNEKVLVPSSNQKLQTDKGTMQRDVIKGTKYDINKQNKTWISCRHQDIFKAAKVPRLDTTVWDHVKFVVMFIGYFRSGHSLVAALLDAHPNIIMSDEYDIMRNWERFPRENRTRDYLFQNLYARSYTLSTAERSAKHCSSQLGYKYYVPNQWQGRFDKYIQVIGDKFGPVTVTALESQKPDKKELFPQMKQAIRIPFKFIHVLRNPFDIIATGVLRGLDYKLTAKERNRFFENPYNGSKNSLLQRSMIGALAGLTRGVVNLIKRFGDDVITIYSEDMAKNPSSELKRLCQFLSVPCSEEYLNDCSSIVRNSPSKSRYAIFWKDGTKNIVTDLIRRTPMLQRYKFDEE